MNSPEFVACCQAELTLMRQLCAFLVEEQRALLALDATALLRLSTQKEMLLAELAALAAPRLAMQVAASLDTPDALNLWLSGDEAARRAWLALESELTRARVYNDMNATLASERGVMAEALLETLSSAVRQNEGYGRSGRVPDKLSGSRRLGSA
ncbi:flagellar export chaperone FlgN [Craterilacuibacter sp.]|uniref:flagellar export chaperone FlgN n=1 Tax=Craterilacuibacter sp. TaxID=2870909 RepID=UPI003F3FD0D9